MAKNTLRKCVVLEKKVGQTPLEVLEAWKVRNPRYKEMPASYAGRLDPMASGKLLVLLGAECKNKDAYTNLDKEYDIEVVLDFKTDTGDALGIPEYHGKETKISNAELRAMLHTQLGTHTIPYPAYASKTVNGKPLFQYALEGTLDTIDIPIHEETLYRIRSRGVSCVPKETLETRILHFLSKAPRSDEPSKVLGADFRQDVIRVGWKTLFAAIHERSFYVLRLRVVCGSGTYMRSLAERIGEELGTTGFALSIRRRKIGTFVPIGKLFGYWKKRY
ncbi:MAG: truB [Parcubacteria group bacterium]|nr:truB [Parcubacteria group bacterium]